MENRQSRLRLTLRAHITQNFSVTQIYLFNNYGNFGDNWDSSPNVSTLNALAGPLTLIIKKCIEVIATGNHVEG